MDLKTALEALDALQKKQQAYRHAMGILDYDGATAAPRGSAANRAETLAILAEETYKIDTAPETIQLLDELFARRSELDFIHRRCVEEMHRSIEETRKIPMDEYVAYQKLVSESENTWHAAKENNDFSLLKPCLARLIDATGRIMSCINPDKPVYDTLLDRYEKGLTREKCNAFFSLVRQELVPLIHQVTAAEPVDESPLQGHFPLDKQRELTDYLMQVVGLDRAHCTVAETEHPFTTGFTKYDVRITTHYFEDNFASSMFSVIHESGHALYDTHPADSLAYTELGSGVSMSIHEGQSRFYENIIGRSRGFIALIAPKLKSLFPGLRAYSNETLYRAFNVSKPSLIRTEADELTYCLHILIRYELEQRLFDKTLSVDDLPAAWNQLYHDYLGIDVPSDREGVLQDVHWAEALFGYFPSYALGSACGAHILHVMKKTVNVDAALKSGDLSPINNWLNERIWQHGALYTPDELLRNALGEDFNPRYYIDYLKEKFTEIYHLA